MSDPAEKYRGKVNPEHKAAMDSIGFASEFLGQHKAYLERFIAAERNSHSIGHILNPTLYSDQIHSRSFAQQVRIVDAALKFLIEIESVKSELEACE